MVTLEIVTKMMDLTVYIQGNGELDTVYQELCLTDHEITFSNWRLHAGRLPDTVHPAASSVPKHKLVPLSPVAQIATVVQETLVEDDEGNVYTTETTTDQHTRDDHPFRHVHDRDTRSPSTSTLEDTAAEKERRVCSDPYAQLNIRVRSSLHQDRRQR